MEIRDEHIKEAEQLLIHGNEFDIVERVPFIKSLSSCDLLAVPGSGKTTALLAKLYCLSKHLPFKDGSGILVLSHTNAAVNEIEKKLKKVAPGLFEYPNFVGTVQSFVNKFLVLPCYSMYLGSVSVHIDDRIYYEEIERVIGRTFNSEISYYKHNNIGIFFNSRFWFNQDNEIILSEGVSNEELKLKIPKKWIKEKTAKTKKDNVFKFIKSMKINLIKKGILHYDDCYFIANEYLKKQSKLANIIQKRFKYVFIDEMQDLEKYQIDIIDKIFYSEESPTVIQRIGDINQSIYNSGKKVKVQANWEPRNPVMYLNNSYRLTKETSDIVNFFTLDRQQDENGNPRFIVNGKRELDIAIPPHLILFEKDTKNQLKNKFIEIIKEFNLDTTPEGEKYGFKIIGWNAKWDDGEAHDDKLRLENIFEDYKKDSSSVKETYNSLSEYLQYFDRNKSTLEVARKAILNALVHILRIEDKTYKVKIRSEEKDRYYTKKELIKHIQNNEINYESFKSKLYKWSFALVADNKYEDVYDDIKEFIKSDFTNWFDIAITEKTNDFIGVNFEQLIPKQNESEKIQSDDIEIGTVHSVKGQTYCATMYVETAYQRPVYETQKIIKRNSNPLLMQEHKCSGKYDKQALKMMYVGFSRPTHLLCFAVLKENIAEEISNYEDKGWKIIDCTE